MSRIDALITEHCPDGVSYRAMGEVGRIFRGKRFVKSDIQESGTPCIHYGEIYTRYGVSASEAFSFLDPQLAQKLRTATKGDVVIATAGETIEDIGTAVAWLGERDVVIHDACYVFRSDLDPKFVSYFLRTSTFKRQARSSISSSKISSISIKNMGKILIPVPPLEVQREIVRILDTFTALEAELEARRIQYSTLVQALFRQLEEADTFPLAKIADISGGFAFLSGRYTEVGTRVIRISDIQKGYISDKDLRFYPSAAVDEFARAAVLKNDIVMSLSGSVGRVAMIHDDHLPAALNQRTARIKPKTAGVNNRYLFHFLNSDRFERSAYESTGGGTVRNISSKWLANVPVPVPSLDEQAHIVSVLDKLDSLTNDLSIGLPAEIEARRKQYEYYRDKLLTFEELPS